MTEILHLDWRLLVKVLHELLAKAKRDKLLAQPTSVMRFVRHDSYVPPNVTDQNARVRRQRALPLLALDRDHGDIWKQTDFGRNRDSVLKLVPLDPRGAYMHAPRKMGAVCYLAGAAGPRTDHYALDQQGFHQAETSVPGYVEDAPPRPLAWRDESSCEFQGGKVQHIPKRQGNQG